MKKSLFLIIIFLPLYSYAGFWGDFWDIMSGAAGDKWADEDIAMINRTFSETLQAGRDAQMLAGFKEAMENQNWPVAAAFSMELGRYDLSYSKEYIQKFSNGYQVLAVALLVQYQRVDMYKKMPSILKIDNEHATDALEIMLKYNYEIGETISLIAAIKYAEQVKTLEGLAKRDRSISGNRSKILSSPLYLCESYLL